MLLGTLGASLLGNLLTGKGVVRAGYGNNKGKGVVRAGYGNQLKKIGFLILPHPLTNFEIRSIIKINYGLMVFIQEIIYLIK